MMYSSFLLWLSVEVLLIGAWVWIAVNRRKLLTRDPNERRVTTGTPLHRERLRKYLWRYLFATIFLMGVPFASLFVLFSLPDVFAPFGVGLVLGKDTIRNLDFLVVLAFLVDQTIKGALFDFFEVYGIDIGNLTVQSQSLIVKSIMVAYRLIITKIVLDLIITITAISTDLAFAKDFTGIGGRGNENRGAPLLNGLDDNLTRPKSGAQV